MTWGRSSTISPIVPTVLPPCQTLPLRAHVAFWSWLLLLLGLVAPANARADSDYEDAIERAVAAYNNGDYEEATRQFERAHGHSPSARTLRGIGVSQFELGHHDRAAEVLNRALASNVAPLLGEMRRETERLLGEALARVGQLRLVIEPDESVLTVDGGARRKLGHDQVLFVIPGPHTLEITKPGYDPARHQIAAGAGRVLELKVELDPIAQPKESSSNRRRWYKNPWFWTTLGVVVVAGSVVGGLALSGRVDKNHGPANSGTADLTINLLRLNEP